MTDDLGELGETLVAHWLQQQQAAILARRWRCRWGELDLVARTTTGVLQFVEVKTRSGGNWDAGGLLAIDSRKQVRLHRSALLFLSRHPLWAELPCEFYLARVSGRRVEADKRSESPAPIVLGYPQQRGSWELTLTDYQAIEIA